MENASKALIIAGAILLSILIISLGIMIFNQASGVVNNNAMTEVEVSTFNEKFTQYLGDKVRGANVKALLNAIKANNMSTDDTSKQISLDTSGDIASLDATPETGSTYMVEVADKDGYTTGGLIKTIKITKNK